MHRGRPRVRRFAVFGSSSSCRPGRQPGGYLFGWTYRGVRTGRYTFGIDTATGTWCSSSGSTTRGRYPTSPRTPPTETSPKSPLPPPRAVRARRNRVQPDIRGGRNTVAAVTAEHVDIEARSRPTGRKALRVTFAGHPGNALSTSLIQACGMAPLRRVRPRGSGRSGTRVGFVVSDTEQD